MMNVVKKNYNSLTQAIATTTEEVDQCNKKAWNLRRSDTAQAISLGEKALNLAKGLRLRIRLRSREFGFWVIATPVCHLQSWR